MATVGSRTMYASSAFTVLHCLYMTLHIPPSDMHQLCYMSEACLNTHVFHLACYQLFMSV